MTALTDEELLLFLRKEWLEDEYYWYEKDENKITIHKMRVKHPKKEHDPEAIGEVVLKSNPLAPTYISRCKKCGAIQIFGKWYK